MKIKGETMIDIVKSYIVERKDPSFGSNFKRKSTAFKRSQ